MQEGKPYQVGKRDFHDDTKKEKGAVNWGACEKS